MKYDILSHPVDLEFAFFEAKLFAFAPDSQSYILVKV
jgi:hypothetical protein